MDMAHHKFMDNVSVPMQKKVAGPDRNSNMSFYLVNKFVFNFPASSSGAPQ